jgi:hypothetical protein
MKCPGTSIAIAITASLALATNIARADAGSDEDAELTFAEGTVEGERIRAVAGDVDDKGIVWIEIYAGAKLSYAYPYTRVLIDGETTTVRDLRELRLGKFGPRGFELAATHGAERLACTVLTAADGEIRCTRDPQWKPPGHEACALGFLGEYTRKDCNVYREWFTNPVVAHDELLQLCTSTYREETNRIECMMFGYNAKDADRFRDVLAACTHAYPGEWRRDSCQFFSFAPVNPADAPSPETIRACDQLHDDDERTNTCVWERHTGVKQTRPKPGPLLPSQLLTAEVRASDPTHASGGRIDVARGAWRELSLRATGGMVGTEPVLWVDAFENHQALKWANVIDRISIGKQIRALREVSSLEAVKLSGDVLTFRVTHDSKKLHCRADAATTYARCRAR